MKRIKLLAGRLTPGHWERWSFSRRVKQVSWIEKHVCWRSSSPKYSKAGLVWKNLSHVVSWTPNYCMQGLLPLLKGRLTYTRPISRIPGEFCGGNQSWSLLWTVSWYISPLITILMRLFIRLYHPFEPAWQIYPQASRSAKKRESQAFLMLYLSLLKD